MSKFANVYLLSFELEYKNTVMRILGFKEGEKMKENINFESVFHEPRPGSLEKNPHP